MMTDTSVTTTILLDQNVPDLHCRSVERPRLAALRYSFASLF
jgi:hypothetical protein